jgi:enediyne biosynthesis thioesterase
MKSYEYKHIVGFEETNLVGNVYYTNFIRWQGRCREMFLREKAADILDLLKNGFAMVTTRVSCEYLNELSAFDELTIVMKLGGIKQNRIAMVFEYWRDEELVARGEQEIACMKREGDSIVPAAVPESLTLALQNY